jgi:hypothetical protein
MVLDWFLFRGTNLDLEMVLLELDQGQKQDQIWSKAYTEIM